MWELPEKLQGEKDPASNVSSLYAFHLECFNRINDPGSGYPADETGQGTWNSSDQNGHGVSFFPWRIDKRIEKKTAQGQQGTGNIEEIPQHKHPDHTHHYRKNP